MRNRAPYLHLLSAPIVGLALVCAGPVLANSKLRPQAQVTEDGTPVGFRVKSQQLAIAPMNLDVSKFAFTAPGRVTNSRVQTVERGFTFTPSRSQKNSVSLGMTTRSTTTASNDRTTAPTSIGLTPSGYDVDVSVAYKGFAVSGGVSKMDTGLGGRKSQGVDVGLGYRAPNWAAGVTAMAERDSSYLAPRGIIDEPRYSVEARGAVAVSPQLSVNGSLRYRPAPHHPTPLDPNKEDRTLLLGGAYAF